MFKEIDIKAFHQRLKDEEDTLTESELEYANALIECVNSFWAAELTPKLYMDMTTMKFSVTSAEYLEGKYH